MAVMAARRGAARVRGAVLSLAVLPLLAGPASVALAAGGAPPASEQRGGQGSEAGSGEETQEVDTENLFGFTEGAETGEKGEQEVLVDSQMRFSKRRGGPGASGYAVASTRLSYQYDPSDRFSVTFGLFGDLRRVRDVVELPDKAFGTFDGGSAELKYAFQKSGRDQPLGIAIETRPRYARLLPIEGRGADYFSMETLLQVDYRLVPDKLWYGSNLGLEPTYARLRGSGESERSSTVLWSHAIVGRLGPHSFLGPELRYLRAYGGTFLNRFEGHALYLGPALYHTVSEKAFVTLAYSAQVAGRDRSPAFAGRAFDLTHFERHAVRVKLGFDF